MARTSCIRFVLDQHAVGFLYSASSLKQQSADSRVGKKVGNTHISQDGGKYWYLPGNKIDS